MGFVNKQHILAIDDEDHILELLRYNLENNSFRVTTCTSVEEAEDILGTQKVDIILLDIMLPGIDGITALEKFRKDKRLQAIPIILLTAKSEEVDKVVGLELGADDYITKPFSVRELIARVKAVLRRNQRTEESTKISKKDDTLTYKKLTLDNESHVVMCDGETLQLTNKEFEVLKFLMTHKGKVLTREVILDKVWGYDYFGETRTVDVHIRYLRSKLEEYGAADYIETVRGVGYKFAKE